MSTLLIENCHIISPDYEVERASILVDGAFIREIFVGGRAPAADRKVDAAGRMTMPGFIDVHCHGRSGADFSDASVEGMALMSQDKLKEGVTSWLPTSLTLSEEMIAAAMETAKAYVASGAPGAKVPGVHLEGPFINPKCLGAQNPDFVRPPDIAEVKRLQKIFPVLKLSYAVEMPGGAEFAGQVCGCGIAPSCVHSQATHAEFLAAAANGLNSLTHFCNQMTPLHHRDIGLVGAGLLHQEVFIELICDKLHICPDMIQLIFEHKDVERIQLVSDAMRAAGMPDGEYTLGGLPVIVAGGAARLASNGSLAGSTLQICDALRNVHEITGKPLTQLVKCVCYNQAQALGLEKLGRIAPGYRADIAILNDRFRPETVLVDGEVRLS